MELSKIHYSREGMKFLQSIYVLSIMSSLGHLAGSSDNSPEIIVGQLPAKKRCRSTDRHSNMFLCTVESMSLCTTCSSGLLLLKNAIKLPFFKTTIKIALTCGRLERRLRVG